MTDIDSDSDKFIDLKKDNSFAAYPAHRHNSHTQKSKSHRPDSYMSETTDQCTLVKIRQINHK